ncbi:thioredoxin domain-containing protein [Deinococcus sp. MIMF12]|uniref:Thioredoxin domain-containing protein n=1 Tax=Deinococcus rhizophilus TaxID=3049544 RepID=A0ABT7JGB5_9DEIO|nr:thioredoxin domain-containing protein [Deinococcus rhizophilus]MDL2344091.1 thioredoxin domain-containing protein [Deinococcus rhizophilus]
MNRLAQETSPYLLQHADNPVDWWPWSPEAFEEARRRDVPVLLSIGYSTCHWCHVMAHESFEDEATAAQMNRDFVSVKVDREERPDVDRVYMTATQLMTGQGGWPMTVFLTPQGEPFYAGTYFPPEDRYGMPGFRRLLATVARAWQEDRAKLLGNAEALTGHIREASRPRGTPDDLPADFLPRAVENLRRVYDADRGGFGGAPKFPGTTTLDFLLTREDGRDMALHTLRRMGAGGIYDQLGGGFHRYSVDERWLVPHFEKMLYDNAQLTRTLLRAAQHTGDDTFTRLARETLAYLEREMLAPEGGFYSAQDADTQGVEGLTFTWTPDEIRAVLNEGGLGDGPDTDLVLRVYGVTEQGNFLDPHRPEYGSRNVLHVPTPPEALARDLGEDVAALLERLDTARMHLFEARQRRPQPGTDTKVLTSWNGLALAAFADAGRILGEVHYLDVARRNAEFVRGRMRLPDGTLRHTYKDGVARVEGLLEDHALYALGLVALYQAGGDLTHLEWARELWDVVRRDFWDEEAGLFRSTGGNAEALLTRQAEAFDAAVLSDNAAATLLGLWMARYYGDGEAERLARRTVQTYAADMLAAPHGMGGLWQAAAFLEAPHVDIALIGTPTERAALERVLARFPLPFAALAPAEQGVGLPVLEGRPGGGTAYVCIGHACDLPTKDPEELAGQLGRL